MYFILIICDSNLYYINEYINQKQNINYFMFLFIFKFNTILNNKNKNCNLYEIINRIFNIINKMNIIDCDSKFD